MNRKSMKAAITDVFCAIQRATDSSSDASRWLTQALTAAEQGERAHRKFCGGRPSSAFALSVGDSARYFVCKWVLYTAKVPASWQDAVTVRTDVMYASAVAEWLNDGQASRAIKPRSEASIEVVRSIDYAGDIAL